MVNYACAFSDLELGEKFEWIIIKVNYLFHMLPLMKTGWHSHRLQRKLGYLLNLDLCCLTREWLLFLSLKLTGERLGNRLKHFFKKRIRYICAWRFCVNSPALYTLYAKPCRFLLRLIKFKSCVTFFSWLVHK